MEVSCELITAIEQKVVGSVLANQTDVPSAKDLTVNVVIVVSFITVGKATHIPHQMSLSIVLS
tara:strand:+ start:370 stop:558 length:189 start_codon:yes stop_codon:yes gene_type:complete